MSSSVAPPPGASVLPDLARGLAGLLAIVALVVGLPVLLWTLAGWPLPTSLPSWDELTRSLQVSHIPDELLARALAVVCWLVWLELVASVVVEAVAVARGRRAASVPLAGPLQRMAARLVAAAALLAVLALSRPDGAPPLSDALALGSVPAASVQTAERDEPAPAPEAAAPATTWTYTVEHRDTLWDIAERHLGDPFRWSEIWQANRGRVQPDGATFTDPDRICPGWQLAVPGVAPAGAAEVGQVGDARAGSDADLARMAPLSGPPGAVLTADGGDGSGSATMAPLGGEQEGRGHGGS